MARESDFFSFFFQKNPSLKIFFFLFEFVLQRIKIYKRKKKLGGGGGGGGGEWG